MSETKPTETLTAADIKKQIDEANKADKIKNELRDSGLPLTGQIANEINASEVSKPVVVPLAESKPQGEPPAEQKPTRESVDFKEWAQKKGINWTTDTSILEALHKSDQAFHRRRAEEKAREAAPQPPAYIPPAYQPQAQAYTVPPKMPRDVVESVARTYNMLPEDVERLAAFNRDFFQAAMKDEREQQNKELEAIRRENQKNSVFRELSTDPVFREPEVAMEFHNVMEQMQSQNPRSFEQDPTAYKRAFETAVYNIGRRNLEGRSLQEGVPLKSRSATPPTTPPRQLGTVSGGGSVENETEFDREAFFKLKTPEEKKAFLTKMGLVSPY